MLENIGRMKEDKKWKTDDREQETKNRREPTKNS